MALVEFEVADHRELELAPGLVCNTAKLIVGVPAPTVKMAVVEPAA